MTQSGIRPHRKDTLLHTNLSPPYERERGLREGAPHAIITGANKHDGAKRKPQMRQLIRISRTYNRVLIFGHNGAAKAASWDDLSPHDEIQKRATRAWEHSDLGSRRDASTTVQQTTRQPMPTGQSEPISDLKHAKPFH